MDSMQTGYGLMTWADGRRYEGYWVNSKCTGFGILTHKDGRRYEGEYVNDKMQVSLAAQAHPELTRPAAAGCGGRERICVGYVEQHRCAFARGCDAKCGRAMACTRGRTGPSTTGNTKTTRRTAAAYIRGLMAPCTKVPHPSRSPHRTEPSSSGIFGPFRH